MPGYQKKSDFFLCAETGPVKINRTAPTNKEAAAIVHTLVEFLFNIFLLLND